jgi:hypothetical protein
MNIDFHYGIIYLAARVAGMAPADAETVAHASQYVDDATTDGPLMFRDGESFDRFASAHKMIDYRNVVQARDDRVWAAFHFLPAGQGTTFEEKAVCRPDSAPARAMAEDMLKTCRESDNPLHRLGVCLHTYVDTWAHQGFSGIISKRNVVRSIALEGSAPIKYLPAFLRAWLPTVFANFLATEVFARIPYIELGHGAASHYPDAPWLKWRYSNALGETISRDNVEDFVVATDMAVRVIRAFLANADTFASQPGLSSDQKNQIKDLLGQNSDEDGENRLRAIGDIVASKGVAAVREPIPAYVAKGKGSWKYLATGIEADDDGSPPLPVYGRQFQASDYRKVHEAIR